MQTDRSLIYFLKTAEEYRLEYDSRRGSAYSRFHGYTYDGIWAVALAIQHVAHRIRHFRKNQTVVDFQYRDPLWEELFLEALRNTSFEGVTVRPKLYFFYRDYAFVLLLLILSVYKLWAMCIIHPSELTAFLCFNGCQYVMSIAGLTPSNATYSLFAHVYTPTSFRI